MRIKIADGGLHVSESVRLQRRKGVHLPHTGLNSRPPWATGALLNVFPKIDFVSAIEWVAGALPMRGKSHPTNELRP